MFFFLLKNEYKSYIFVKFADFRMYSLAAPFNPNEIRSFPEAIYTILNIFVTL